MTGRETEGDSDMSVYLKFLLGYSVLYISLIFVAIPHERVGEEDLVSIPRWAALILFPPLAIGKLKSYLTFAVALQVGALINLLGAGVCALLEFLGVSVPLVVPKILFGLLILSMIIGMIIWLIIRYRKTHIRR